MRHFPTKLFAIAMGLALAGCASTATPASTTTSDVAQTPPRAALITRAEVVAVVANRDSATDLEQKAARWGYALKQKEALAGLDLWLLTFDCPPGIDPEVASRELVRLQPTSAVEADYKYSLQAPILRRSALMPQATPLRYANALIDWPKDGCEPVVRVGMIDGAVDLRVASLQGRNVNVRSFVARSAASDHGTAVAELLVGKGRLRNAELRAAEVVSMDANGETYSGVRPMLRALDWMVRENVGVVNISLAGPYNSTLERGIDRARLRGVRVVAAVGNAGADAPPLYPAALPNVIAATAVDSDQQIYTKAVRGAHVDIAAPGVDIFVGDAETGRYISGTSVAAPFVVARIASDPELAGERNTQKLLRKLAANSRDLGDEGPDETFGSGLITTGNCR